MEFKDFYYDQLFEHLFSKFVLQFSFLMIAFSPYKNYINAFLYVHVDYSKYIIEH